MKSLLAFLLLSATCFGQSFGTFTISSTAAIQAEKSQGTLIEVTKDRVQPKEKFYVKIKDDLPYKIQGNPWFQSEKEELGDDGSRLVEIIAGDKDITIIVEHKIVKLTEADLEALPLFASEEGREAWFYKNASAEVRDSRTVFVGKGPDPNPDPDPDPPKPPDDPQSRKVYEEAVRLKIPFAECQKVASNMRVVIAEAVSTSLPLAEIVKKIKAANEPITKDKPHWDAWEKIIPVTFTITTRDDAIEVYKKISDGLGAVK